MTGSIAGALFQGARSRHQSWPGCSLTLTEGSGCPAIGGPTSVILVETTGLVRGNCLRPEVNSLLVSVYFTHL